MHKVRSRRARLSSSLLILGVACLAATVAPPLQSQEGDAGEYEVEILGLDPYLEIPEENPMSDAKVALGRQLFFDPRLSVDRTVSCATCHDPEHAWADDAPISTGVGGRKGTRSALTILNAAYNMRQFWDGRVGTLEEQALRPIEDPIELAHSLDAVVKDLSHVKGYVGQFEAVFGTPVTAEGIARAIAAFERTLLTGNSPVDRYEAGNEDAISESAKRGRTIFKSKKGNCNTCHAGFNYTDNVYHNLGVGWEAEGRDLGRSAVTKSAADRGAFKTPTLRDIALTAPYMHDGSEKTLEDVIEFYVEGGVTNPHLDEEMRPRKLTDQDKRDLVQFLRALTGDTRPDGTPPILPR